MNLSVIQYNVIMMAINNARNEILADAFIDPYEQTEQYTNETLLKALNEVEDLIMTSNTPT